jgi:hypothetical protein
MKSIYMSCSDGASNKFVHTEYDAEILYNIHNATKLLPYLKVIHKFSGGTR